MFPIKGCCLQLFSVSLLTAGIYGFGVTIANASDIMEGSSLVVNQEDDIISLAATQTTSSQQNTSASGSNATASTTTKPTSSSKSSSSVKKDPNQSDPLPTQGAVAIDSQGVGVATVGGDFGGSQEMWFRPSISRSKDLTGNATGESFIVYMEYDYYDDMNDFYIELPFVFSNTAKEYGSDGALINSNRPTGGTLDTRYTRTVWYSKKSKALKKVGVSMLLQKELDPDNAGVRLEPGIVFMGGLRQLENFFWSFRTSLGYYIARTDSSTPPESENLRVRFDTTFRYNFGSVFASYRCDLRLYNDILTGDSHNQTYHRLKFGTSKAVQDNFLFAVELGQSIRRGTLEQQQTSIKDDRWRNDTYIELQVGFVL